MLMIDLSYFEKRIPTILALGFKESAIPQLRKYIELLWTCNEDLNLISRKMTFQELIDNHVIDCLLPLKLIPDGIQTIADFGTGGGLPGIIYAIHFSDINFQLFEKSILKQGFLNKCKSIASNIKIIETIPQDLPEVNLVIARAFKPIDVILDMSRLYYNSSGKYFLLKARKEKIDEEFSLAKKKFKNLEIKVLELQSPVLEVERNLVLIN